MISAGTIDVTEVGIGSEKDHCQETIRATELEVQAIVD